MKPILFYICSFIIIVSTLGLCDDFGSAYIYQEFANSTVNTFGYPPWVVDGDYTTTSKNGNLYQNYTMPINGNGSIIWLASFNPGPRNHTFNLSSKDFLNAEKIFQTHFFSTDATDTLTLNAYNYTSNSWKQIYTTGNGGANLWEDSVFWGASYNPEDISVVDNSINFTSDGGELCGWDGSQYVTCGPTSDITPTFSLDMNLSVDFLAITDQQANYSTLLSGGINYTNCTKVGINNWVCIASWNLSHGINTLYISGKNPSYEMNDTLWSLFKANTFNISIDILPPNYAMLNNSPLQPQLNQTINFTFNLTDETNVSSFIFSWNNSGQWINDTPISYVTGSYLKNLTNTTQHDTFYWKLYYNDTLGNSNMTEVNFVQISKIKPTVNISIIPNPANETDNLTLSLIFSDVEFDLWTSNETRWYNESILLSEYNDSLTLGFGNFSSGNNITVEVRVYDGFNYSDWTSQTIIIKDNDEPIMENYSVESPIIVGNVGYVYASCYDNISAISLVEFFIKDPTGTHFSGTTNTNYSGNIFRKGFAMNTIGTWYFVNATCYDISGNYFTNTSINLSISVEATPTPPTTPGGGGSSTTISECSKDEDCLIYSLNHKCISNKCIEITRESQAYQNLLAIFKEQDISEAEAQIAISQLLETAEKKCNFDGVCQGEEGENTYNCGSSVKTVNNKNIYIPGDCSVVDALKGQSKFLTFVFWGLIVSGLVVLGFYYKSNQTKKARRG